MKILAIEREIKGVSWENSSELLREEAKHVYQLYLADTLREKIGRASCRERV